MNELEVAQETIRRISNVLTEMNTREINSGEDAVSKIEDILEGYYELRPRS